MHGKEIFFFAVFKKEKIDGGFPNSLPSLTFDSPKDGKANFTPDTIFNAKKKSITCLDSCTLIRGM